jgi:hypothetical protein
MNPRELEERLTGLRNRFTQAYDDLNRIRAEHGLSLDDVIVPSAVPPEMIDASPELRAVAEERARKLKALPDDVKAAVARTSDVGDQLLEARVRLTFILLQQGCSTSEIASRTGLSRDDVDALATG